MTILGLLLAAVVGLSIGLLGGGDAILTVPIFRYMLGFGAKEAIVSNLAVVGLASLVGSGEPWREGHKALHRARLQRSRQGWRVRQRPARYSPRRVLALSRETLVLSEHGVEPVPFDRALTAGTFAGACEKVGLLRMQEEAFVEMRLERIPYKPPNYGSIVELKEAGVLPEEDPAELEAGANRCAAS